MAKPTIARSFSINGDRAKVTAIRRINSKRCYVRVVSMVVHESHDFADGEVWSKDGLDSRPGEFIRRLGASDALVEAFETELNRLYWANDAEK